MEDESNPSLEEIAGMDEIQKKISAAIEEAQRTGKTRVDIVLDEDPVRVQPGDMVEVACRAALENGKVISNQEGSVLKIVAGTDTGIPGIGYAVLGMGPDEKKSTVIEPEQAFGAHLDENTQAFPVKRNIPRDIRISTEEYKKKSSTLPVKGGKIWITPYFPSEVTEVTEAYILLHNLATDGRVEQAPFGRTTVSLEGDAITITLTPILGAEFEAGEKKGFIISADQDRFVVDFNHPFAGQKLFLDLSLVSLTKASAFKDIHIPWIEDHDTGLETARLKGKPAVLILYADWCQWCKKLFEETFTDPRIKLLKDEFVWVKANSDLDPGLKSFYRQEGFPAMVFMDAKGNIVKKLEGFKDADGFLAELEQMTDLERAEAGR